MSHRRTSPPRRVTAALGTLVVAAVAACSDAPNEVSNLGDSRDTGTVSIALPAARVTSTVRAQVEAWNQAHPDERAEIVTLPDDPRQAHERIATDADSGVATASVVALDSSWVAEFVDARWLEALPRDRFPLADYAAPMANLGRDGTSVVAVPYRVRTEVLYYRTDMLAAAPSTWEELRRGCADVARPRQISCLRAPLSADAGLAETVTRLVAANGGQLIDDAGVPHADDPSTRDAVAKLAEAVAAGDVDAVDAGRDAHRQAFADGKALFLWDTVDTAPSLLDGPVAAAPLPRLSEDGRALVTATVLAVPTTAEHKKSALELLSFLSAPARAAERVSGDGDASPSTEQYDEAARAARPQLAVVRQVLPAAQAGPVVTRRAEVDAAMTDYLEPILRGNTPAQTGLELLQNRLERLTPG